MSASSAAHVIKNFRIHEINGLRSHLLRFGPLPPASGVVPLNAELSLPNPFLPMKDIRKGSWIPPKYSLRRQAELVKQAKEAGLLHLLPPGPKNPMSQLKEELTKAGVKFTEHNESLKKEEDSESILSTELSSINGANEGELFTAKLESIEQEEVADVEDNFWKSPIAWHGEFKEKSVAGAELGIRLYAGKTRMFKGHKWERVKESREKRQAVLLRDMDARIERYKSWYKKRRPNPLRPPKTVKSPKLPF
ncbi:hypothetical protein BDQ17DRAFT_1397542 [Cyathus striatus]|nr:hypothetical protein BDQ17DRAFT_1397542 [Cyathus striatus]